MYESGPLEARQKKLVWGQAQKTEGKERSSRAVVRVLVGEGRLRQKSAPTDFVSDDNCRGERRSAMPVARTVKFRSSQLGRRWGIEVLVRL